MNEKNKRLIQDQFGAHADQYVSSKVHAKGYSLQRLVELIQPGSDWRVLDIATGGGHTALAFAQIAEWVAASDLTHRMLIAAGRFCEEQGQRNMSMCQHDAEHLPFADGTFDCVTCRIAPHHFSSVPAFVAEAVRVLKPGGVLGVADNVVSGEPKVAQFVNTFEKLRDPSHQWAYAAADWETFFLSAGLTITAVETFEKEMDFNNWAARMGVEGDDLTRLQALLVQAPENVQEWLRPDMVGAKLVFRLFEGIVIGRKETT